MHGLTYRMNAAPQDVISLDLFKDEILTINNNNSISFTPINDEVKYRDHNQKQTGC